MIHILPNRRPEINRASPQHDPENPETVSGPHITAPMGGRKGHVRSQHMWVTGLVLGPESSVWELVDSFGDDLVVCVAVIGNGDDGNHITAVDIDRVAVGAICI